MHQILFKNSSVYKDLIDTFLCAFCLLSIPDYGIAASPSISDDSIFPYSCCDLSTSSATSECPDSEVPLLGRYIKDEHYYHNGQAAIENALNNLQMRIKIARNSVFIAICRQSGDKWRSKTLFLTFFRSTLVDSVNVFDCRLPGVITGAYPLRHWKLNSQHPHPYSHGISNPPYPHASNIITVLYSNLDVSLCDPFVSIIVCLIVNYLL